MPRPRVFNDPRVKVHKYPPTLPQVKSIHHTPCDLIPKSWIEFYNRIIEPQMLVMLTSPYRTTLRRSIRGEPTICGFADDVSEGFLIEPLDIIETLTDTYMAIFLTPEALLETAGVVILTYLLDKDLRRALTPMLKFPKCAPRPDLPQGYANLTTPLPAATNTWVGPAFTNSGGPAEMWGVGPSYSVASCPVAGTYFYSLTLTCGPYIAGIKADGTLQVRIMATVAGVSWQVGGSIAVPIGALETKTTGCSAMVPDLPAHASLHAEFFRQNASGCTIGPAQAYCEYIQQETVH